MKKYRAISIIKKIRIKKSGSVMAASIIEAASTRNLDFCFLVRRRIRLTPLTLKEMKEK